MILLKFIEIIQRERVRHKEKGQRSAKRSSEVLSVSSIKRVQEEKSRIKVSNLIKIIPVERTATKE